MFENSEPNCSSLFFLISIGRSGSHHSSAPSSKEGDAENKGKEYFTIQSNCRRKRLNRKWRIVVPMVLFK
ncbi:hypothetical protein RO3G_13676 [Rhizopus delemar RA 99-880]|uniref:Uncharacterized protein n=1 Tax=Rhizopus delemar (strain RA 99-880 / ATCC MYA-4621 / FGSC 9543 / NRRL 43880) TaxID=246409 RepID=I1CKI5_RHIO9|nr:hypothetical protein RO3G_13676 [Rhizopus delemar RA 99-880]|eukprot:EIE88965.1 hypothetical protein RO3G_13676 [Rhizopus delemar RA 99-880]